MVRHRHLRGWSPLKSDPELFGIARRAFNIPVEEVLFVDDWSTHVPTAIQLGFRRVPASSREGTANDGKHFAAVDAARPLPAAG
jgi:FMN phosphatase YigB (HAD superfamily)